MSSPYDSPWDYGYPPAQQGAGYYNPDMEGDGRDTGDRRRPSQTPRTPGDYYAGGQRFPNGDYSGYSHEESSYRTTSQQGRPMLNSHHPNHMGAPQSGGHPYRQNVPPSDYGPSAPSSAVYSNPQAENFTSGQPKHSRRVSQSSNINGPLHPPGLGIPHDPPGLRSQLITTENSNQSLDPRYVVQTNPRRFFKQGRVFSVLWHENAGSNLRNIQTFASRAVYPTRYGQNVYSHIRRMVVVKEHAQCAWCFAIYTYQGRGLSKYSADAAKHSIIYTEGTRPMPAPDEPRMSKLPLEMKPVSLDQRLDPMSRLNFSKLFTVEHNVKVLHVGKITERSMPTFLGYAQQELAI